VFFRVYSRANFFGYITGNLGYLDKWILPAKEREDKKETKNKSFLFSFSRLFAPFRGQIF
jgi:hypothetical protein